MKVIMHLQTEEDLILASRAAKRMAKRTDTNFCGVLYGDRYSFTMKRLKSGTIVVYKDVVNDR